MKINAARRLRSHRVVDSWYKDNDGERTPIESAVVPEVAQALKDWATQVRHCVLIGGLAVSYYGRARATMDVDFLFIAHSHVPQEVAGFKRIREHAFQHNQTHVEIEVLDPEFLHMSQELAYKIGSTAVEKGLVHVASREGLIASKLGRFSLQDQADIEHVFQPGLDFSSWPLSDLQRERLAKFSKL